MRSLHVTVIACLLILPMTTRAEDADLEFTPIFNGRDLSGWEGRDGYWHVHEGAITGETTRRRPLEHHSYLIWRGGMPSDFELRLEFTSTPRSR